MVNKKYKWTNKRSKLGEYAILQREHGITPQACSAKSTNPDLTAVTTCFLRVPIQRGLLTPDSSTCSVFSASHMVISWQYR